MKTNNLYSIYRWSRRPEPPHRSGFDSGSRKRAAQARNTCMGEVSFLCLKKKFLYLLRKFLLGLSVGMELINRLNRECVCVILNDFYGNPTYPELGTRHICYGHRVMFFFRCVTAVFFRYFSMLHRCFVSRVIQFFQTCHKKCRVIKCQLLKLVSTLIHAHSPLPSSGHPLPPFWRKNSPVPLSGHPPPFLLAANLTPHFQWSSSTLPAGGQIHRLLVF